jgi:hypothetical protein
MSSLLGAGNPGECCAFVAIQNKRDNRESIENVLMKMIFICDS